MILARLRARLQTAWTGSTIAEVDTDTGELVRVPGRHPARERSWWWRAWQTVLSSWA